MAKQVQKSQRNRDMSEAMNQYEKLVQENDKLKKALGDLQTQYAQEKNAQELVTDQALARRLRVKLSWLRAEAEAGRLPHVKAGRRLLFSFNAVKSVLTERAKTEGIREAAHA